MIIAQFFETGGQFSMRNQDGARNMPIRKLTLAANVEHERMVGWVLDEVALADLVDLGRRCLPMRPLVRKIEFHAWGLRKDADTKSRYQTGASWHA